VLEELRGSASGKGICICFAIAFASLASPLSQLLTAAVINSVGSLASGLRQFGDL